MKAYILTEGDYSDYNIEAVTLDKEVANHYEKLHPGSNIEEFNLLDKSYLDIYNVEYLNNNVMLKNISGTDADNPRDYYNYGTRYSLMTSDNVNKINKIYIKEVNGTWTTAYMDFNVKRRPNEELQDTILRSKKIIEDTVSHMQYLIETEGWTWEMVKEHYETTDKHIIKE